MKIQTKLEMKIKWMMSCLIINLKALQITMKKKIKLQGFRKYLSKRTVKYNSNYYSLQKKYVTTNLSSLCLRPRTRRGHHLQKTRARACSSDSVINGAMRPHMRLALAGARVRARSGGDFCAHLGTRSRPRRSSQEPMRIFGL